MSADSPVPPAEATLTVAQRSRWATVLDLLASALPPQGRLVLVDSADDRTAQLADRLADRVRADGRPCARLTDATCTSHDDGRRAYAAGTIVIASGPRWRDHLPAGGWHLTIWVRTPSAHGTHANGYHGDHADAIVDLHDPGWPVIRHLAPWLIPTDSWYRSESQAFFATRAATWDTKFGADLPAYTAAITAAGLTPAGVAVDVGCGTGRAFPALRNALGSHGTIIGVDHTPEMITTARSRAREYQAILLLADAHQLPLADASTDVIFAAGLINHLPRTATGLAELARIARPGGKLVIFHPSGRATLAARHGRTLRPDEPLAEAVLRATATHTGWHLTSYDDEPHRFYAIAVRQSERPGACHVNG